MIKIIPLTLLITFALALNYPLYKQCDSKWAREQLGTSPTETICSAGCLMSSASMALYAVGNTQFNPSTLNKWLTSNGGYASGDLFIWASVNRFGVNFLGKVTRDKIKDYISSGYIVIPNVHNGRHWVLATGFEGDNILVNDPGYSVTSYTLDEIVEGNTGVYSITKAPLSLSSWFYSLQRRIIRK